VFFHFSLLRCMLKV